MVLFSQSLRIIKCCLKRHIHKSLRILWPEHEVNQGPAFVTKLAVDFTVNRLQNADPLERGTAQMSKPELEEKK